MGAGYKVIKKLGEGAFGSVELIEKDHKYYALKSISLDKLNKNYVDQCQKYNNKNMFRIKRNT